MFRNAILYTKARIIRTPLEPLAKIVQRALGFNYRRSTPELWEVHQENEMLPLVLRKLLREDSSCVDVGCHIGSFLSLIFKFAPNGRHTAFEPVECKISWLNRTFPEATIVHAAASDRQGSSAFSEDKDRPGYSRLAENGDGYAVPTITLDDYLLNLPRVDFIKIDTEGHELQVLIGAQSVIAKFKPAIIFECGSEYEVGLNRKALYDLIVTRLNYEIFIFSDFISGKLPLTFQQFRECGLYPFRAFNFLAIPSLVTRI